MNHIMLTPQLAITDMDHTRVAMDSLESIVRVLGHCGIYERLYSQQNLDASQSLNDSLLQLYVLVLQFVCYVRRHLGLNTAGTRRSSFSEAFAD